MPRTQRGRDPGGNGATVASGNSTAGVLPPGEPAVAASVREAAASQNLVADSSAKPQLEPAAPSMPQAACQLKAAAEATPQAPSAVQPMAKPKDVVVHVEVIHGGYTNVKVPVAVCPRYDGMAVAGAAKAFDRQIDSWLTCAVDLGMIGSGLGQLFPVNLERSRDAGRVKVDALLLVGMGQPGDFAADDLRYPMSNVTVAVKSMGHDHFSTMLIGTRRNELCIGHAVRGLLEGIIDGYERFRVIADAVTFKREDFLKLADGDIFVSLVEADADRAERILDELQAVAAEGSIPKLQLEPARGEAVEPDHVDDPNNVDVDPYVPVSVLRVTKSSAAPATVSSSAPVDTTAITVFEYTGISDVAAVTVRENEVNPYLVRELPDRMANASSDEEREALGVFFTSILIPHDFQKLTDGTVDLCIEVDETTAAIPWEMAAHKKYSKTNFLGTSVGVSRQFRTLLSPPPGSPPPLNRRIKVLVIADPRRAHCDCRTRVKKAWQSSMSWTSPGRSGTANTNSR